jgi:rare lipoprotein A (peptidoglycan hydrolase)
MAAISSTAHCLDLTQLVPRRAVARVAAPARRRGQQGRRAGPLLAGLLALLVLAVAAGALWTLLPERHAAAPSAVPRQVGLASWYGPGFYGRPTASGRVYTGRALTAAHRWLPLGTRVRVTNLENGRRVVVQVDDRGPYVGGRVIDLSAAAARRLDMVEDGVVRVRVEVVGRAERPRA